MKDKDWRELFQNEKKRVHLRYYMKERVKNAVEQKGKGSPGTGAMKGALHAGEGIRKQPPESYGS